MPLPMLYIYNIVTRYLCLFFVFWSCGFEQTLCSFIGGYQHFRGTFYFSLHGILKKYVSLQCVYQPIRLHIIITEKTPVLTFTVTKSYFLSYVEWLQNFSIWYLTFPVLHSHTCSNAVICLRKVVLVGECANVIITHDFIYAFVSLVEFILYCHTASTANMAVTEPGDTFTNIHEAKHIVRG
jgi:hypothetical protein